jgi:ABC-type lipoprotein release transport system permease subunit
MSIKKVRGILMYKIAFRNIFRHKRRSVLTALTMLGGFVLAAMAIGWADGSYQNIINMFTRNRLGHIQIHAKGYLDKPSLYKNIDRVNQIGQKISQIQGVESWSPRLYSAGLASAGDKSAAVQIIGVDPERENATTHFDRKVTQGGSLPREPSGEVLLGKGLATTLHATVGDEVVIVSQAADGSLANDLYRLRGIVESGDEAQDHMAFYLHIKDAQALLAMEGRVHEMVIIVHRLDRVRALSSKIKQILNRPDLEVAPWQEFARSFYTAMKADKMGNWIMIFIIILIVAIGVLNTVLMSVLERQREYGVLKALGTRPRQILGLVIYEINMLAIFSIVMGSGLAYLANNWLSRHGITLSEPFSYGGMTFHTLYSMINVKSFLVPALAVLGTATLVSFLPALKAARTVPAKTMRAV